MKQWLRNYPLPWWQRVHPVLFGMAAAALIILIYNIWRRCGL